MSAGNFRNLTVYKKAYNLAMIVFDLTKKFPPEEKYALTDQIRRSSRSVCRAIGEGYRKRQYPSHFSNKMSDADMENTETQVSIDFAFSCGYITKEENLEVRKRSEEIGRMLNHMIENPEKYQRKGRN
ncbi:MAG: four helix bundle protein [Balneolaceae bacterium]|nr:four helix bundle protein [Balneolaceae bacterium]MCH8549397.1 four helix bundle protein [Balneolaceae bacterium]